MDQPKEAISQDELNRIHLREPEVGDIWQCRLVPQHAVLRILPNGNLVIAEYTPTRQSTTTKRSYRVNLERAREITPGMHAGMVKGGGSGVFVADVYSADRSTFRALVMYWQENWQEAYTPVGGDVPIPPPVVKPLPPPPPPPLKKQYKHKLVLDGVLIARMTTDTYKALLERTKGRNRVCNAALVDDIDTLEDDVLMTVLQLTDPEDE